MSDCRFMYGGKQVSRGDAEAIVRGGHSVYCSKHPEVLFDRSAFRSHVAIADGTYPREWGSAKTWGTKKSGGDYCRICKGPHKPKHGRS